MPDGPAPSPNRDNEKTEGFALPRALTFASVGLYIVGLLIVNLDLARDGIWDVELSRPQYILVGLLWAVLNGLALAWLPVALRMIGLFFQTFHPKSWPWYRVPVVVLGFALLLFLLAVAEALLFMVLVWFPLYVALGLQHVSGLIYFSDFIQALSVGFGGLFLFLEASRHRNLHSLPVIGRPLQRISERSPKTDSPNWVVSLPLGIFLLVMSISLYAYSLYPLLSKIVGGGRPSNVRLILDHPLYAAWPSHIWVSPSGERLRSSPELSLRSTISCGVTSRNETWGSSSSATSPSASHHR